MAAMRVIPPLDELEDCDACFDLGFEAAALEQFAFERGKEAFAHRVIEAIADGTHGGPHAGLLTTLTKANEVYWLP